MGGVPGFLCRFTGWLFLGDNCGSKKSGVLLCHYFENMGGACAAEIISL
jgi:hypothetical protein